MCTTYAGQAHYELSPPDSPGAAERRASVQPIVLAAGGGQEQDRAHVEEHRLLAQLRQSGCSGDRLVARDRLAYRLDREAGMLQRRRVRRLWSRPALKGHGYPVTFDDVRISVVAVVVGGSWARSRHLGERMRYGQAQPPVLPEQASGLTDRTFEIVHVVQSHEDRDQVGASGVRPRRPSPHARSIVRRPGSGSRFKNCGRFRCS